MARSYKFASLQMLNYMWTNKIKPLIDENVITLYCSGLDIVSPDVPGQ